tara:strand:- start:163 stop:1053 length:891 start_codon:yes stop_codon:yes gene_type:complete
MYRKRKLKRGDIVKFDFKTVRGMVIQKEMAIDEFCRINEIDNSKLRTAIDEGSWLRIPELRTLDIRKLKQILLYPSIMIGDLGVLENIYKKRINNSSVNIEPHVIKGRIDQTTSSRDVVKFAFMTIKDNNGEDIKDIKFESSGDNRLAIPLEYLSLIGEELVVYPVSKMTKSELEIHIKNELEAAAAAGPALVSPVDSAPASPVDSAPARSQARGKRRHPSKPRNPRPPMPPLEDDEEDDEDTPPPLRYMPAPELPGGGKRKKYKKRSKTKKYKKKRSKKNKTKRKIRSKRRTRRS